MVEGTQRAEQLTVAEITFAIPAQSFGITCWISTEEALPVVTEFAVRMIHVCGALAPAQLQAFFGFTDKEVVAVVRTLEDEKLVHWEDDQLVLTHYALGRFLDSSDAVPRFFKISEWSGEVIFDLISFSHMKRSHRLRRTNAMVELLSRDRDKQSKTIYWAERSFQENFRKIMRRDRTEIYKVSDVEGGERFMIPLPCSFNIELEERLNIGRSLQDDLFAEQLEVAEAISDALSTPTVTGEIRALEEFIDLFQEKLLKTYMKAGRFDIRKYIEDVHVWRREGYGQDTEALMGSLYLQSNRRKLAAWTKEWAVAEAGHQKQAPLSACWLAPQIRLWGRSLSVRAVNDEQSRLLRGESPDKADPVLDEHREQSGVKAVLQCGGIKDIEQYARIHRSSFPKLFGASGTIMNGQCELFVVPDRFVAALYHHYIGSSIPVPIGFISREPARVKASVELIRSFLTVGQGVFSLGRETPYRDVHKEMGFILGSGV